MLSFNVNSPMFLFVKKRKNILMKREFFRYLDRNRIYEISSDFLKILFI